jgi:uncharacterized protein (TIGR00730 family)
MTKNWITVFGGSSPKPGEPQYIDGIRLGEKLAKGGFTVLTGGYIGVMEAVSRGAAEAGGHVIGITCEEIEKWRPVGPNPWVIEEIRFPTLRQRLFALVETCEAAIALPGGIGTLAEISMMWTHLDIGSIPPKPLILVGSGWQNTMDQLFKSFPEYIPKKQQNWLSFLPDIDAAFITLIDKLAS